MSLLEIEIKSYCNDHGPVRDKLAARGARHAGSAVERDTYYNHPARDFARTDEALRIRETGGSALLTYKGPKIGSLSKTRVEEEISVSDPDALRKILEFLGFTASGTVVKNREHYIMGGIEVCLDSVEGLGLFVELEKKDNDRERVERELFAAARELGLDRFERRSYLELKYFT